jgi:DNA polymerase III, gamma/tau subunits
MNILQQSLPIKYRPARWKDFVGQEVIVRYLSNLVKRGQGKNLIFAGHFGSGKTSSAVYYAKCMLCENPTESADSCNSCPQCSFWDNGERNHPSFHEQDGASNSGVQKIRELLDIMNTPPLYGKYRVVLIDEVQSLSKQAWDALLKTIEEPPLFLITIFLQLNLIKFVQLSNPGVSVLK